MVTPVHSAKYAIATKWDAKTASCATATAGNAHAPEDTQEATVRLLRDAQRQDATTAEYADKAHFTAPNAMRGTMVHSAKNAIANDSDAHAHEAFQAVIVVLLWDAQWQAATTVEHAALETLTAAVATLVTSVDSATYPIVANSDAKTAARATASAVNACVCQATRATSVRRFKGAQRKDATEAHATPRTASVRVLLIGRGRTAKRTSPSIA
jgi:hypothetical protein